MNSNLNRALSAALVAFGGVVSAVAQVDTDYLCVDINNTKPYSDDYRYEQKESDLFGATLGLSGTKSYVSPLPCLGGGPIAGRIGFYIGQRGSFQDEDPNQAGAFQDAGGNALHDNFLELTRGGNLARTTGRSYFPPAAYPGIYQGPPAGGSSFARIYVQQGTAAATNYLFGGTGFNLFYAGAAGRFILADASVDGTAANNSVDVRLILEVIGDAARLNWRLTNNLATTDGVSIGLYFAQNVELYTGIPGPQGIEPEQLVVPITDRPGGVPFVTIPGRRPLTLEERFNRSGLGPAGEAGGATVGVPPFVNFSMNQAAGFGLQVVNSPSALTGFDPNSGIDQTPVDEFVFGDPNTLFDGQFNATDPKISDFIFNAPGNGNNDAASVTASPGYVQKWLPTGVTTGNFRDIVAYYRSTNGDSSYSTAFNGYSAVIDTPKAISTNPATIATDQPFQSSRYTIRVNVDNTGGYSNPDTAVTLQSVNVTLNLPSGITDADSGSRTITKTISSIAPKNVAFVDFPVTVDANVFGPQTYTVTISPNPKIGDKTVTGVIDVAAAPRLLIRQNANLVSPPFTFTDSSWETVLSTPTSPQSLNQTFQAFTWDALRQQYVPQVSAERGRGTFIVSTGDLGYRALGGTPRQPNDEFPSPANYDVAQNGGAPIIRLQPGWNLIGNPYNYSFPINQIIGAAVGATQSVKFTDLIAAGYTDGTFQYYDQDGKQYLPISNSTSSDPRILPNFGYWIYANFAFDLQFPPIYELFARAAGPKPEAPQTVKDWRLQLSAATANSRDTQNFVGATSDLATKSVRKAPMQPSSAKGDVLYAYISGDGGPVLAQSLRHATGTQSFTYNVFSKNGGPVTVSWPNLAAIPSSFKVSFSDSAAKKSVNPRDTVGYTFTAKSESVRSFTITVAPQAPAPERITSATYASVRSAKGLAAKLSFVTTVKGTATIHLFRGGTSLGDIVAGLSVGAGQNSVVWPYIDGSGKALPIGNYSVVFEVTGEGGDVATRIMPITLRR